MKLNKKVVSLINEGFKAKTLKGFNDVQINQLYERVVKNKKKKENKEATTSTVTKTTYSQSEAKGKSFPGVTTINSDGSVTVTKESEMKESDITSKNALGMDAIQSYTGQESPHDEDDMAPDGMDDDSDNNRSEMGESKKKVNPWAICTSQLKGEFGTSERHLWNAKQKNKYERCVKDVKKENKGNISENLFLEEKILNLVQKYVEPKMTKRDFISLIENKSSDAPTTKPKEPTTKPGTKTPPKEKPFDPFKPSPSKQPNPKAKKKETKEQNAPTTKPKEPTTKPGTKTPPKEKPFDPFKPSPSKQPNPKAKSKVPDWLSFNKLGVKFKK